MNQVESNQNQAFMLVMSGLSSILTYLAGLVIVHQVSPTNFSAYSATASILMIVGIVTTSMQQWPVANLLARGYRTGAMKLALFGSVATGLVFGFLAQALVSKFGSADLAFAAAAAVFVVCVGAASAGFLQAYCSTKTMGALRLVEALIRSVAMVLGAVQQDIALAIAAIVFGTGTFTVLSWVAVFAQLKRTEHVTNQPTKTAPAMIVQTALAGLALQGLGTLLTNIAVLTVVTGNEGASSEISDYQAITVLSRVPVLVAGALALVMFVPLTKGKFTAAWNSLNFYMRVATVASLVVITLPGSIVSMLLSSHATAYQPATVVPLAISGWLGGLVLLLTAVAQARLQTRWPVFVLAAAVLIDAQLAPTLWHQFGGAAMATADALVIGGCALLLARGLRKHAPRMFTALTSLSWALLWIPLALLSYTATAQPSILVAYVLFVGAIGIASLIQRKHPNGDVKHLRILHLAYEDPRQPGAGGGSIHSHEVDERLTALGHKVIAVHRRYAGAKLRIENGVTWRPLGLTRLTDSNLKLSTIGYYLALPFALPFLIARHNPDVIVDDFGAPITALPLRWFTTHPVIGMAQWADAAGKAKEYHVKITWIEKLGLSSHRDIIAVSEDLAVSLRKRASHAKVHVIPNGVPDAAREKRNPVKTKSWRSKQNVVFLGRLESPQKGVDTLLDAWAILHKTQPERELWIIGDGPDKGQLEAQSDALGLQSVVKFVGRIDGAERLDYLADAALVAMPSHYETFGMVAAEALAVGTPIVVTDIDSLRHFVTEKTGRVVAGHDPANWADAIANALDEKLRNSARVAGPELTARFDWNQITLEIEKVLKQARRFVSIDKRSDDSALREALPANVTTLLVGNYGNGNTGDEAILARLVEQAQSPALITVASRHPEAIMKTHGVNAVSLVSLAGFKTWLRAKRVVVGGGGMFGPGQPILVSVLPALLIASRILGKSIAFAGVGVYQGMPRFARLVLGVATRLADPCLVRDDASTRTLDLRFGSKKLVQIPDAGWALDTNDAAAREYLSQRSIEPHRPLLLISPKAGLDSTMNELAIKSLAAAAKSWYDRGGQVAFLLLSRGSEFDLGKPWSDEVLSLKIAARAEVPIETFGPDLKPTLAKSLVAFADGVIGMRFHALVFAASAGTPMASLTFEEKSRAVIAEYGGFNVLPDAWSENSFDLWIDEQLQKRGSADTKHFEDRTCTIESPDLAKRLRTDVKVVQSNPSCTQPKLSIVMPSYNTDPQELVSTVKRALEVAGEHGEVIVVDDGSTNGSPDLLRDFEGPLLVVRQPNGGKGAALRTGMALARGSWVGLIDADGDYAPEELPRLIEIARERGDLMAVGHRDLVQAKYERFRLIASWAFRIWTKIWLNPGVSDTEAGIKVISQQLIPMLLPELTENQFAIDVDMFAALERLGMTSAEGPVSFVHDDHTTVTLRRGALAFVGVVRVALRQLR